MLRQVRYVFFFFSDVAGDLFYYFMSLFYYIASNGTTEVDFILFLLHLFYFYCFCCIALLQMAPCRVAILSKQSNLGLADNKTYPKK